MKTKNASNPMLPGVLNPWTSDSKFNSLLSEPIWHVLLSVHVLLDFFDWDDLGRANRA